MIPRFLLAFGLLSALMPIGMTIFAADTIGHGSINTAQYKGCDPIHDPQGCPKVTPAIETQV